MPATADRSWTPGPPEPRLAQGAVHVWRADLQAVPDELAGALCPEERARAGRLLSERDRRLWARSRGVLRALLGQYLRRDPSALRFAAGAHGKPELRDDAAGSTAAFKDGSAKLPQPSFNLSH